MVSVATPQSFPTETHASQVQGVEQTPRRSFSMDGSAASHLQSPDTPHAPLKHGQHGAHVRQLQRQLNEIGYRDIDGELHADGDFSDRTRRAVEAFQYDYGLVVDGIVGDRTKAALKHAERALRVPRMSACIS
jgi:peptidoglycan hydrolase-like protein with peptidoglycan-binding domain